MASAVTGLSNGAAAAPKTAESTASQAGTDVFLQLMVAQLRNQNPLDPADPVEFLTQLAQFTQLEQTIAMRQDLTAIRQAVGEAAAAAEGQ